MKNSQTRFQVAAIQMVASTQVEDNLQQASDLIAQAVDGGATLLVLPEYFCFMGRQDHDKLALKETLGQGPIQDFLSNQASKHGIWLVGGTLPLASPDADRVYNSLLVYDPSGAMVARYDKVHLFGYVRGEESYDESRAIKPGDNVPQTFTGLGGKRVYPCVMTFVFQSCIGH